MPNELRDKHILVTRPAHQAGPLIQKLKAHQATPISLPLIAIKAYQPEQVPDISGFDHLESCAIGTATIPQMSTSLVVAIVAFQLNLLDQILINAIVVMSIVTTLIAPSLMEHYFKKIQQNQNGKQN